MTDQHSVTEDITPTSFFGALTSAIKGVATGGAMFVAAPCLLLWNECNTVAVEAMIGQAESACTENVSSSKVDKANEGKCVHMIGDTKSKATLKDSEIGISAKGAIKLNRSAEMYQWKETKKEKKSSDGKTKTTTYSYSKVWSSTYYDSSKFNKGEGSKEKINKIMKYKSKTVTAKAGEVSFGAFKLSDEQIKKIGPASKYTLDKEQIKNVKINKAKLDQGDLYLGKKPSKPKVGDYRISYTAVLPGKTSLLAVQKGSSFVPFKAGKKAMSVISTGTKSKADIIAAERSANNMMKWVFRIVGFFLSWIGIGMIFKPLTVVSDKIPLIGGLISGGVGFVAFGIAAFVSFGAMSLGWIVARPLIGGLLCLLSLAPVVLLVVLAIKKKSSEGA